MTYQLTEFQSKQLHRMANVDGGNLLTIVGPHESDSAEEKKTLTEWLHNAQDLDGLGLLDEKSDLFHEVVGRVRAETGRIVKIYQLSKVGLLMFRDSKLRLPN